MAVSPSSQCSLCTLQVASACCSQSCFNTHPTCYRDCGGVLIHEDIILTAAHCTNNFAPGVLIGNTKRDGSDGEKFGVTMSRPHPRYDTKTTDNDIMLVKLSRPSKAPVAKWNAHKAKPADGESVKVMGFGTTSFKGSTSEILLETTLKVVNFDTCDAAWGKGRLKRESQLCATAPGADTCQGDSGGPMLNSANEVIGIVSFGRGCADPTQPPGVYARVSGFDDWIRSGICEMSANPPMSCKAQMSVRAVDVAGPSDDVALISGGTTYVDLSGPAALGAYATGRWSPAETFSYTIPNLSSGAKYTVKLGWAENYPLAAKNGFREFDVEIQGATVETALDVFKTVGLNTALEMQYEVTANSSGQVVITFKKRTQNPIINRIEILGTAPVRAIDVAGPSDDVALISGGTTNLAYSGNAALGSFGSQRWSPDAVFSYIIPNLNPGLKYKVKLGWAEFYQPVCSNGKRVFDVSIQGNTVETALDVFQAVGCNSILQKEYIATAGADGKLVITFAKRIENPIISRIEILTFV